MFFESIHLVYYFSRYLGCGHDSIIITDDNLYSKWLSYGKVDLVWPKCNISSHFKRTIVHIGNHDRKNRNVIFPSSMWMSLFTLHVASNVYRYIKIFPASPDPLIYGKWYHTSIGIPFNY